MYNSVGLKLLDVMYNVLRNPNFWVMKFYMRCAECKVAKTKLDGIFIKKF